MCSGVEGEGGNESELRVEPGGVVQTEITLCGLLEGASSGKVELALVNAVRVVLVNVVAEELEGWSFAILMSEALNELVVLGPFVNLPNCTAWNREVNCDVAFGSSPHLRVLFISFVDEVFQ